MMKHAYKGIVLGICMLLLSVSTAFAQVGGLGIPSEYPVIGDSIQDGDIVSFNPSVNVHEVTLIRADENMFGVIESAPAVVFRSSAAGVPVIQVGEAFVNVTDQNGSITIGDTITSSVIPGKATKADDSDQYVLGIALQSFDAENATTTAIVGSREVAFGTIRVLLQIGPALNAQNADVTPATIFVRENTGETETGLETIFRYVTAVLFTLGTLYVVVKTFGPNVGKGVISIGRNPLARTSIQAMVVFNVILILAISIVSFIVSLLIIFLPIN